MGYSTESRQVSHATTYTTADDIAATGDSAVIWDILTPITVKRIGALVTVAPGAAAAIVDFDRRILTGSDAGRVSKLDGTNGRITIPGTTAAGKIVYKDVSVDLNPGDQIVPEVVDAATTGDARYYYEYIQRHEVAGNLTDMVESA